ncbi:hypothetical protein [Nocardia brasiliensis]|uniref:hypothetical protein n=1 Tax=Nocardia brasiliensis TaxID=37326 RepID=UPI0018932C62|nr:hypothetical protein [Nocardia brasiliensis]MBF6548888.1 hypothetical protein [Nocardia brasiliensis]
MPREVEGGIVRRWYCDNYRCPYSWHETRWCPEQLRPAEVAEVELTPEQQQAVWEWRQERARRAGTQPERTRAAPPAAPPKPWHGWLPVVIAVASLILVVLLSVLGAR